MKKNKQQETMESGDARDLRIVLLGDSGVGKSSIANAILGREAFKESRTTKSELQTGRVEDRNISIIDTPGFFNTHLTDEELQEQMMKSLSLAHPGPHVFLLVINLETFREEQRNIVSKIQKIVGAQAFKFTMVLVTGREKISRREWMLFILDTKFQELVSHCRDNYHAINSENMINQTDISELLQKIDETIKQNNHRHYNNEIYQMSRTKSIRVKKNQEEEKTFKRKETEIKQQQTKSASETFTTHNIMEERTTLINVQNSTCAVIEELNESITKKKKEEENTYRGKRQEKEERQEGAKIKSDTFESTLKDRSTHNVNVVTQRMQTTHDLYKNLDTGSLKRFVQLPNETVKIEKSGISHKNTYQVVEESKTLRIVMLGKTGAGKSATGNTILREKVFEEKCSLKSVTKTCQQHLKVVDSKWILVTDTPGLFDTSVKKKDLKAEIERCVEMSVPGPHVFLLVIRLDMRFTEEEKKTVKLIQENFGKTATHYTIILFTKGDQLDTPIKEFLKENNQINELVRQCGGRYHVFNNTDENPRQVSELLKKIDSMVMRNSGQYYTNEMYEKAQRKIMMKKVGDAALVGASVAGVGAAVAGGAVLVAATGGVALPVALMAGGAALAGGPSAKVITKKIKHKGKE